MGGGDHDKHDRFARRDATEAVDDGDAKKRPALLRLADGAPHLLFRHAGIVFEFECGERRAIVAT